MRIGILTFHNAVNYGAVLQCWALYKRLSLLNHEVFIIDYFSHFIKEQYSVFSWNCLKRKTLKGKVTYCGIHILRGMKIYNRNIKFDLFSKKEFTYIKTDEINSNLNAVITGSDQVWNTLLTGGYDNMYFLEFPIDSYIRKISFAASSEFIHFREELSRNVKMRNAISRIHYLSVREEALAEELRHKIGKDIQVVSDPTLLLTAEQYESITAKRLIEEQYIFVFQVVYSSHTMKIAKKIARERRLRIIYVNARYMFFHKEKNIRISIGPSEFLSLIKYSSFVITTSFHGTAFSIIYRKQFYTVKTPCMSRQINLLETLGLSERIIMNISNINNNDIEYLEEFNNRMKGYMCKSNLFIKKCLNYDFE